MIDSSLLYYLVVFSETHSLLKASEILHLSQPSLSKAMKKLEDELDLTLFDRQANKMTLNENGLEILQYAKEIVNMNDSLIKRACSLKENELTISIGYTAPGVLFKFPELFSAGISKEKVITSIDEETTLLNGLKDNTFDLIFINNKIDNLNYVCKKVMSEHLFISIPKTHFLSGMKEVKFSDIDGQSFLLFSFVGIWRQILDKNLHNSNFIENSKLENLKELNEYSSIPSFVTNVSKNNNLPSNRISIPIIDDDAYLDFYAVYKKNRTDIAKILK